MLDFGSYLLGFSCGAIVGLIAGIWIWGERTPRPETSNLHEPLETRLIRMAVKR